jgi:hypothetical protein
MAHQLSADDRRFREDFEACRIQPDAFDHRAHVRLAYMYLAENNVDRALSLMRDALLVFIAHNGIPAAKYHETLTRAWILAVHHFMSTSDAAASADAFIDDNPRLLNTKIMMSHYSAAALFSPEARATFVEPNLDPIPRHAE